MDGIIETSTIPHEKFTIPLPWNKGSGRKVTYYIAGIKAEFIRGYDKFQIHEKIEGDDEGYGGAVLEFLMKNGEIEKVKGPFHKHKEGHLRILYEILTA